MRSFALLIHCGVSVRVALLSNLISTIISAFGMLLGVALANIANIAPYIFMITAGMFFYIALAAMVCTYAHTHAHAHAHAQHMHNVSICALVYSYTSTESISILYMYCTVYTHSVPCLMTHILCSYFSPPPTSFVSHS